MQRACGNWRESPKGAVSPDAKDYTHDDWKAGARAIIERDELLAELAQARAEVAEAKQRAGIYGLDDCRKSAKAALIALGFPTEGYWDRWRAVPEKLPPFDAWHVECAILDALTQEGVAAWHGDASGCVTQIVQAQAKRAEAAEAERDRLKAALTDARIFIHYEPAIQRLDAALAPQAEKRT
jgi:hypothetical protein